MFDFMIKFVFGVGCATVGILLWLLICWLWDVIKEFYFNHIHKDTFKVNYVFRLSNIIPDKSNHNYVLVAGNQSFEKYVKARDGYEAVAKVMKDVGTRIVVIDVDMISGW